MGLAIDLTGVGEAIKGIGSGITDFISHVQGKLSPTEQAQLQQLADQTEATQMATQAAINQVEAASTNWLVAGWRPFIGWVCGAAIAYNFLLIPFGTLALQIVGSRYNMPTVDYSALWTLVMAMLGVGTMRTVEKLQNAQGNH